MNTQKIRQDIFKFLKRHGIMTLAAYSKELWVCTVYYGVDDQMNLYIVTNPSSKHGKYIANYPNVAFAIFDSHTKVTDQKEGLQGQGICTMIEKQEDVIRALKIWHQANPGIESRITPEAVKKWPDTKLYKIRPTQIKFYNDKLYGKKEYALLDL